MFKVNNRSFSSVSIVDFDCQQSKMLAGKALLKKFAKFTRKHLQCNFFSQSCIPTACNLSSEAATTGSIKVGVLRTFTKFKGKHLCRRLLFSCEFCKISKNTFFTEHVWTTNSLSFLVNLARNLLIFLKKQLFHKTTRRKCF